MTDYTLEDTIYQKFSTRSFSTGGPTTLSGTPVVSAYEDDGTTQITAGITLSADFDTVTGLNNLTIAATAANGFETGKDYSLVVTTGTVGGVSVVGEVVGEFSIGRASANVTAISGDSIAADNLELQYDGTGLSGDTFPAAGDYTISGSHSDIAGPSTPVIDTGAAVANVNLTMPDYAQGIEIRNLNTLGTDLFSISGKGQIIYAASSSGAVNQRGNWKVTNTGGVTITTDDVAQNVTDTLAASEAILLDTGTDGVLLAATATSPKLVDDFYDEAESGHNVGGSFGKGFRQVKEGTVSAESTVNDASATATVFVTALSSAVNDFYVDVSLVFIDGILAGQSRPVLSYNGTTKEITLEEALTSAPGNGDAFIIKTDHVHPVSQIQSGLATEAKQDIIDGKVDAVKVDTAAILVDTGTTIPAAISGLNDISAVQVNAEVLDVMVTDTFAEPSGVPAATASLKDKIGYIAAKTRNKTTQTATTFTVRNDADSGDIATSAVSDDGTTFTKGEDS